MVSVGVVLVAVVATAMATAVTSPGSAHATTPNGAAASSVVDGSANCWTTTGRSTLATVADAHTGSVTPLAVGTGAPYEGFELGVARTDGCALPVTPGHAYAITLWYRSPFPIHARVYVYRPDRGWKRWFTTAALPASADWHSGSLVTPNMLDGTTVVTVALWSEAAGQVGVDDLSQTDLGARPPAPWARFRALFPQTPTIMVNEYSHWNAEHDDAVPSSIWDMTSGSLFATGGRGYSGAVNAGRVDATSSSITNSAVFRLNTTSFAFGNVAVDLGVYLARYGSTTTTPPVDWDGVDVWLRYQSQYSLYDAELQRRDGRVAIKKKCVGGPDNGGTYYTLGQVRDAPMALGVWTAAGASVRNVTGGVSITVYRAGRPLLTVTDRGIGCPAITVDGAVGIRGDNTEFYFRDFVVSEPLAP